MLQVNLRDGRLEETEGNGFSKKGPTVKLSKYDPESKTYVSFYLYPDDIEEMRLVLHRLEKELKMTPSEKLIQLLLREKYCIFDIQCLQLYTWKIRLRIDDRACEVQAENLEQAFREILRYLSYEKLEIPYSNLPMLESKFNTLALSYAKMKKYHSYHTRLSYNWITNRWTLMLVFGIPCLMAEHPKLDKTFEMFNDYLTCETTKMAENSKPLKNQILIQKFDSLDNELLDEIPISRFVDLYPRLSVNHEPDFVERILNGETLYSISYHFKKK